MRGHQSARQQQPPQQPPQQQPGSAAQSAPAAPPVPAFSLPLRQQSTGKTVEVRQVWRENLDAEFRALRGAIQTHRFVALDVEFPGVVARSIAGPDTLYETLRCNVDLLSPIQVAFALANEAGQSPSLDSGEAVAAWQFNFRFSLSDDLYATSSIEILERAGVNFNNLLHHGIDPVAFGELLMSSGLILDEDVSWVTFHSGFVLAHMLKLATCKDMPPAVAGFYEQTKLYLPTLWDTRQMIARIRHGKWTGGLDALAKEMGVERHGPAYQAAPDAFLNLNVFFAMCSRFFPGGIAALNSSTGLTGVVFGLSENVDDNHHHGTRQASNKTPSPLFAASDLSEISPFEQASQFSAQQLQDKRPLFGSAR